MHRKQGEERAEVVRQRTSAQQAGEMKRIFGNENKRCHKRRGSYDPNEGRTLETCTGLERSLHGHIVEVNQEGVLPWVTQGSG